MPFPPSEREHDACEDIIVNAEAALRFTAGMTFAVFEADQLTNYAVVRSLGIISDASRCLGSETQARHATVPWRDIAEAGNSFRDAYDRVALDIVWKTVHDHLKSIIAACHAELSRPPVP